MDGDSWTHMDRHMDGQMTQGKTIYPMTCMAEGKIDKVFSAVHIIQNQASHTHQWYAYFNNFLLNNSMMNLNEGTIISRHCNKLCIN